MTINEEEKGGETHLRIQSQKTLSKCVQATYAQNMDAELQILKTPSTWITWMRTYCVCI